MNKNDKKKWEKWKKKRLPLFTRPPPLPHPPLQPLPQPPFIPNFPHPWLPFLLDLPRHVFPAVTPVVLRGNCTSTHSRSPRYLAQTPVASSPWNLPWTMENIQGVANSNMRACYMQGLYVQ